MEIKIERSLLEKLLQSSNNMKIELDRITEILNGCTNKLNSQDEEWKIISGFENYEISNYGQVRRIKDKNGKPMNKLMSTPWNKQKYIRIDGSLNDMSRQIVYIYNNNRKQCGVTLFLLIIRTFFIMPIVTENKISSGTKNIIQNEFTKMITEKIDENKPATIDNLRINFIKRGIRHFKHKLSNKQVRLIRNNVNDMSFKDFYNNYKDQFSNVAKSTVSSVYYGRNWRVRTEPLAKMKHQTEDYPYGKFPIVVYKKNN